MNWLVGWCVFTSCGWWGEQLGKCLLVLEQEVLNEGQFGTTSEVYFFQVLSQLHHSQRLATFLN